MKIVLSWPVVALWPNRKAHYMAKSKAAKVAKKEAYYATKILPRPSLPEGRIPMKITFFPPDGIKRDWDGAASACKAFFDGVALALGIDDSRFRPVIIDFGEVRKGGAVEIEI